MAEIRRILADSFKELVQEKGFQKIIVKDITDRAKVKRPTFYTYFRDKYDVIDWIFEQEIWQPARSLISAGYTKEGLRFMLVCMEKDKAFYRRLVSLEGQNSFKEIMERYIQDEVKEVLTKSGFQSKNRLLTPNTIAEYLANMFWFVMQKWMSYDGEISAEELLEIYDLLASDSLEEILKEKLDRKPITLAAWKQEYDRLQAEYAKLSPQYKPLREDLMKMRRVQYCVDRVLQRRQPEQEAPKKKQDIEL